MKRLGSKNELRAVPPPPGSSGRILGALLVEQGRLTPERAERVATRQKDLGLRYGETAVKLGYVTDNDVRTALSSQYGYTYLNPGQGSLGLELVTAYDPFGLQAEAIRKLRTELLLRWFNPEQKLLAIVSANTGDGRSYLAANLAVSFSQLGERTLLVDADMRSPRQHRLFACDNAVGLSSNLSGRTDTHLDGIVQIPTFPSLFLLPAGPTPPNPLELLGHASMPILLAHLAEHYAVIIIDTPAGSRNADAQVVAARAGGALVLARKDRTPVADLQRMADTIAASGTPIVGTTLNHY